MTKCCLFLDIAENTGDNFIYVILPVKTYDDIPLDTRPVTLIQSIVRSRDIASDTIPVCIRDTHGLKFMNKKGDELVGDTELFPASNKQKSDSIIPDSEAEILNIFC